MGIKLIAGIVLCIVAAAGVGTAIYAWGEEADARDTYNEKSDELIDHYKGDGTEADATELVESRTDALDNAENIERRGGLAMAVALILAVLGVMLIVIDVMKIKLPGEEDETPAED
ncbi:MAG: hypothetical protein QGH39_09905 [Candidatus Thermoplasmatota archaeon]|jgi:hypothetical protein|nr:hypothetical protein [Candidatus Thermoplasmatota archaeon]MDP7265855.1 hypothetical protein [Candidatus Thermoplasmatota archaeon]